MPSRKPAIPRSEPRCTECGGPLKLSVAEGPYGQIVSSRCGACARITVRYDGEGALEAIGAARLAGRPGLISPARAEEIGKARERLAEAERQYEELNARTLQRDPRVTASALSAAAQRIVDARDRLRRLRTT